MITGKDLYLARYEHEGGMWEANEHQQIWNEWADRLNARLASDRPSDTAAFAAEVMGLAMDHMPVDMAVLSPRDVVRKVFKEYGEMKRAARDRSSDDKEQK